MAHPSQPLTRKIPSGFEDDTFEVDCYQECHWPSHQEMVGGGYPLNPTLRQFFDNTPNEEREAQEIEDWWGLPFIQSYSWEDVEHHRRDTQARHRLEQNQYVQTDAELEAEIAKHKESWFAAYPSGTRYDVRCLDGGAWDRSTNWGAVGSLEEAIELCRLGPSWARSR